MKDNEILPPNVKVNRGKTKDTYYYRTNVDGKRKSIPVGHTFADMMTAIRELENIGSILPKTLVQIWEHYSNNELLLRSSETVKDYTRCWKHISSTLGKFKLEDIQPYHIKQYLTVRTAKVRGNREKALISILFNHARSHGFYNGYNPCAGIKGNKETGRDRYIEHWEYEEIWNNADSILRIAMDLMLYTGQRVSDVLDMKRSDIKGNQLMVKSTKTDRKIGILIEGQLRNVLMSIISDDSTIKSLYLVCNKKGQKLSLSALEDKWETARKKAGYKPFEIQMRDIRAKNASDDTLENANLRLMHTTTNMTDKYRRKHKGAVVRPLQKLI